MPTFIDKKEASNLLQVSTRTIDRYITNNTLSRKFENGKVYLKKNEVLDLSKRRHRKVYKKRGAQEEEPLISPKQNQAKEHVPNSVQRESKSQENTAPQSPSLSSNTKSEDKVYQDLYEELKNELKMYQQKLEGANYRVGQLEAKLETAIPLLEHERRLGIEQKEVKQLKAAQIETYREMDIMQNEYKNETYNKKVLIAVILVLLLLQPLWLLLNIF